MSLDYDAVYGAMSVVELKTELREAGLNVGGKKKELVQRLVSHASEAALKPTPKRKNANNGESSAAKKKPKKFASKPPLKKVESVIVWEPKPDAELPNIEGDDGTKLKVVSWNLNGFKACSKKPYMLEYIQKEKPDVLCFQETKLQSDATPGPFFLPDFKVIIAILADTILKHRYWSCSTVKKGYSGTAVLSKVKPLNVTYGINASRHDGEGRAITLEFDDFYLINTYVPNAGDKLVRLDRRLQWNEDFLRFVQSLDFKKPVVWCGDMNVAHEEIDIHQPKGNHKNAGFTPEERRDFGHFLSQGFVDTWRATHPAVQQYSYWGYRFNCRGKNKGWRIDYFVTSERYKDRVCASFIRNEVLGSDHVPIGALIDTTK